MRAAVLLTLVAAIAGCGAQPTQPEQSTAAVQTAPVTPAVPAAPGAPVVAAAEGAASAAAGEQVVQKSKKTPSGYRRVKRGGKELYCKSVVTLGSRFADEMCFTREQIEEIAERTESALGDMEQGRKVCVGIEGCGG